jgi:hypothetical protein
MKKILIHLLMATLLLALLTPRVLAFSYIIDMAGAPSTTLTTPPGIGTTSGDLFYVNLLPAALFEYSTPSVVSLGLLSTLPAVPGDGQSGHFSSTADYFFKIGRGDGSLTGTYLTPPSVFGPDLVHATATLTGDLAISASGIASSTVDFTGGSATVVSGPNAGAVSAPGTDPENGFAANELTLDYDGTPVHLYVDEITSVPAPGAATLSLSGYVTDVPEPSLAALLLSFCAVGVLLRFRLWISSRAGDD